jgi:hypothetical protein
MKAGPQDPFIARRLRAQRLAAPMAPDPAAVVAWFGAVQAQDYAGAKWALTLRAPKLTDDQLDQALADGTIIRTHGPRPTWHFLAPASARSVLAAVGPSVLKRSEGLNRANEIDAPLMKRVFRIWEKTLGQGRFATRTALGTALGKAGIQATGLRLAQITMWAELEQVICSGPRVGKQFTYALFDERVPGTRPPRDEAVIALAERYVVSHGPVTIRDFVWWSGLTTAEARRAFDAVSPALRKEALDTDIYWSAPAAPPAAQRSTPAVHLLPNYDEYFIAYRDRGPTAIETAPVGGDPRDAFANLLCVEGRFGGIWRRTIGRQRVEIELAPYRPLTTAHQEAAHEAARRHAAFLGLPPTVTFRR